MPRDPRYDVLFEPVTIGPVTTRNRFYAVPQCNGMGYRDPSAAAHMRGIKAEGGWGVVFTEQAEIHYSSEITPFIEARLWDDRDIPALRLTTDAVHEYGSLAGIELCYNGMNGPNFYTREIPMGPANLPVATFTNDPVQARAMTHADIQNLRRWHRAAALRAKRAGFDIVYVYAGHALGVLHHFLSPHYNHRTDEYGGSPENRIRLLKEMIEDTKDAVGDRCAVGCRITVDELLGERGLQHHEVEDMIGLIAESPDVWDLVLAGWENDSRTSRFAPEGHEEEFVKGVKRLTTKPVVGVGRFTSPDAMVGQIRRGVLDLIGAARPSIADPFLPKKIEEGRADEIRECIGCNICVSGDFTMSPIRCTQNPTMGETWRRGWHPERIRAKASDRRILVIGGGPAGLECTLALGNRGYEVALADKDAALGGRVTRECKLPGLAAWGRVRDYRVNLINKRSNVSVYLANALTATDALALEFQEIVVATGAVWRRDGVARYHSEPIKVDSSASVLTPDDLMAGKRPPGHQVVLFDDDHYYMGNVCAELLVNEGYAVTLVTPANEVANWTHATMEQGFIQKRMLDLGVELCVHAAVTAVTAGAVEVADVSTGKVAQRACDGVVMVTARLPDDGLYQDLLSRKATWSDTGVQGVTAIGDCVAPGIIAAAVYSGHKYAEEFDGPKQTGDSVPFRREITEILREEEVDHHA